MARTGRFGRLPRAAPNLASTIVTMVREVNAQEDQNMINAWEEGGLYKGEKVTDKMLLDHFRKRRDSMSPTDPLWDKWNTTLQNYEFNIEESKMSLAYAEKRVDETAMANFYREWAGKLPPDSEAYRSLMRSAAQFTDAAAARAGSGGGGGGGGRRSSGGGSSRRSSGGDGPSATYEAEFLNTYEKYERSYDTAYSWLLDAAYYEGILQPTDPDDASLPDLFGGDEIDHSQVMELFTLMWKSNDPFYKDLRAGLAEVGITQMSYGQFIQMTESKTLGLNARAALADANGDKDGAKALKKEAEAFLLERAVIRDLDEYDWYQRRRLQIDADLASGDLNPWEVVNLLTDFRNDLTRLRDAGYREGGSLELQGFFNREITALGGRAGPGGLGPTATEGTVGGIRNADTADQNYLAGIMSDAQRLVELVNARQGVMWQYTDPATKQRGYRVVTLDDPVLQNGRVVMNGVPGGGGIPSFTELQQRRGTNVATVAPGAAPMFFEMMPIYGAASTGENPRTGLPEAQVAPTNGNEIGRTFTLNGKTYYGLYQNRQLQWFDTNPFAADAGSVTNEDGSITVFRQIPDNMLSRDNPDDPDQVTGFDWEFLLNPKYTTAMQQRTGYGTPAAPSPNKFDNEYRALYISDPIARKGLLDATDQDLQFVAAMSGTPTRTFNMLMGMRNTVVDDHNAIRQAQRDFGFSRSTLSGRAELMSRIAAGEDMKDRTELPPEAKERVRWAVRDTEAREAAQAARTPTRATAPKKLYGPKAVEAANAGLQSEGFEWGKATPGWRSWGSEMAQGVYSPRPLPEIKVPEVTDAAGRRIVPRAVTPEVTPSYTPPAYYNAPTPTPTVAPRPAPTPRITPRIPDLQEADPYEEQYQAPVIRTPVISRRTPVITTRGGGGARVI